MLFVGSAGDNLTIIGLNGPLSKEEAIDLAGKLAVMADDMDCEKVKAAALAFANS